MRLLVNADDLGASRKVNEAIFALMEKGALRSASLLANAPAFEQAAARAATIARCSFGVHLNVTHGSPLGDDPGLRPLLDAQGSFLADAIRRHARQVSVQAAVLAEWSRQIERVSAAGVAVSHLDSHDHVHTIPWLFGTLEKVRARFGIARVRVPRTVEREYSLAGLPKRAAKTLWRNRLRRKGARTTDLLLGLSDYHRLSGEGRGFAGQTIELMVHPGREKSAAETALLSSPWWTEQLHAHPLISYAEL